jgi:hypothetical protein
LLQLLLLLMHTILRSLRLSIHHFILNQSLNHQGCQLLIHSLLARPQVQRKSSVGHRQSFSLYLKAKALKLFSPTRRQLQTLLSQ